MNKILVLSDLLEFTPIVANKAIYLSDKYKKQLDVLHVEDESFFKFFKDKKEASLGKGEALLKDIYQNKAEVICKYGELISTIKEYIQSNNISFVIAGFKRERTLVDDIFNGSNLMSIIRKINTPILVIKTEEQPEYKNILIPTDLSKASKKNIEYLVKLFPEATFHLEHYYKTFFEEKVSLYGFDKNEETDFVDFYKTEAESSFINFVKSLDLPKDIKIFTEIKKYENIKMLVNKTVENKSIDLLSLSIGTDLSIFSFELLENSKKDVIIYKVEN